MRTGGWIALACVMLLSAPAVADPAVGSFFERHVERLVARPTPVGPVAIARDDASWLLTLPAETVVQVEAQSARTAPFSLRAGEAGAAEDSLVLPTTHAGLFLSGPAVWRVRVDPLAGADVDIRVTFRGHVADADGAPASFALEDEPASTLCVVSGVCLP